MRPTAHIAATFHRPGAGRGNVGGAVVPVVSRGFKGSGTPSSRRAPAVLIAALAVIASLAITAAPASASEVGPISNVSYASADLSGTVSASGFVTNWSFEYSTDEATWSPSPSASGTFFFTTGEKPVHPTIEHLKGGTKYFIRLNVEGTKSPEASPYPEFTTLPVDPPSVIATDNASEVEYTTATVSGEISRPANPDPAFDVNCHFQYVTDAQFTATGFENPGEALCEPQSNPTENPIHTAGPSQVIARLTGLANDTTYHLRLFVSNASPTTAAKEAPSTFKTLTVGPPSVISTDNASEVEYTQAQVKGVVERPNTSPDPAFDITCNFEYISDAQFTINPPGEEFAGATPVACEPEAHPAENPITATGQTPVKATLPGLVPSTEYHLRLSASNQGGSDAKEAAVTFVTTGPIPKPAVISTNDATGVTIHEAKVEGEIERPAGKDPALDVNCNFEYISDKQFNENEANSLPGFEGAGQTICQQTELAPIKSEGKTPVSAELVGLRPGTTFHLRLAAQNGGGVVTKDAAGTFTTVPAELPTIIIDPVASGTYTTAHVSGTVDIDDPGHHEAYAYIEVSADGGVTWDGVSIPNPGHSGINVVERNVTGLQPNSTYTFRIKSTYSGGFPPEVEANGEMAFSPEPNPSITTEELFAPTATINPANPVTASTAHLSGTVDPHAPGGALSGLGKEAFATHWEFVCTPECKNANGNPIEGTVQGEEGAQPVAGDAKRLEPNTHYEVFLVIHSEGGDETVGPEFFDTEFIKPTVKAAPGASDGQGGYTLQGVVNPNNSAVTDCKFEWGPNSSRYDFSAPCSPAPGDKGQPVTVEAHLTGLTPDATYHAKLVATNGAGTEDGGDQTFVPTLNPAESCPENEQLRIENNSLALPECRAYEQVTAPNKAGSSASLTDYTDDGAVAYQSRAGNIANSGDGGGIFVNYAANRTSAGWETVSNLNGPTGSPDTGIGVLPRPQILRSLIWWGPYGLLELHVGTSDDLTHRIFNGLEDAGGSNNPLVFGPGVYEFVGSGADLTDSDLPRRVDVDNFGDPVSECPNENRVTAQGDAVSRDGNVVIFTVNGTDRSCANANLTNGRGMRGEVWARVDGTTTYDLSASRCIPGCAFPEAPATFQGASTDGSRVYFTTTAQLLNTDTDHTNDLYACDLPSGTQASTGAANSCASLSQVSGPAPEAKVEEVFSVSEDGSTVYFAASGLLAENPDALGETAQVGDHNLYAWRTSTTHPAGQTTFIARLLGDDLLNSQTHAQSTPDGHYLVFSTSTPFVPTDTDRARDVYRYDAETGVLARLSTNVSGVGGNVDGFDASILTTISGTGTTSRAAHVSVSDNGQAIVFVTREPLSPLDGNGEPDVYLWSAGHVALISTGAVGGGAGNAAISGSGKDIFFETFQALTPSDGDDAGDVYDARLGGGFSFAQAAACSGETCQSLASPPPAAPVSMTTQPPADPGNVKPCPKGRVAKGSRCIKKKAKHHRNSHKRTGHNRGGSK